MNKDERAIIEKLAEFLEEAHQKDIDDNHGDNDLEEGPCSYCCAIEKATAIIEKHDSVTPPDVTLRVYLTEGGYHQEISVWDPEHGQENILVSGDHEFKSGPYAINDLRKSLIKGLIRGLDGWQRNTEYFLF